MKYGADPNMALIRKYWKPDSKAVDADHEAKLKASIEKLDPGKPVISLVLYGDQYRELRAEIVDDLSLK